MKAARLYAPQNLKIEEVNIPEINDEEVLIENKVALTCGTDLKMYKRGHPYAKLPLTIGHEFAGVIVKVGSKVKNFKKGDRVVAVNSAPCNTCFYCKRGKQNLCEKIEEDMIGFTIEGAYAQYVKVPAKIVKQNMHIIPEHISFEEAAILEPLACVVHGNQLLNLNIKDDVAIIGSGPIGLLHLQLIKAEGCKAIVIDLSKERLKVAEELGADITINANEVNPIEEIKKITNGRGVDTAIEAVGLPETWRIAVALTRKGGETLLFGGCKPGDLAEFDASHIHYGELTIKGAFHHTPLAVEKALKLIVSKVIRIDKIISHRMNLSNIEDALKLMAEGKAVKVAITP
ncbi:alcohol dehydrogenase catalytic domain-containing protein [Candidatus Bathyarchaeota archaeon]|nr:alcohol dehydrogenase catalytic domain-containing protein [Candidatus Bathyarchaeota archaeon]